MQPDIKKFYIVKVTNREVKAYNGNILTPEGEITYLDKSDGWPSHTATAKGAHRFDHVPTEDEVARWDGMPWFNRIRSAEVIEVTEETYFKRTEKSLGPVGGQA